MNLIIVPKNKYSIKKYLKKGVNSFILGLKDFCVNYKCKFSIKDIIKLKNKYPDINIFISIDKMINNKDIEDLTEVLLAIDKLNTKGILFYDNSLLVLKKKLNLKVNLVWNNSYCVVNYNACNYYYDKGCKIGLVSSEITIDEIIEINNKTKMDLIVNVFGYLSMSYSKRSLLHNYFKDSKQLKLKHHYQLTEKSSKAKILIKEDKLGTSLYHYELLNASNEIFKLIDNNINNLLFIEDYINETLFNKVIDKYLFIKDNYKTLNKEEVINDLNNIINSNYNGFFNKKTIYKVKQ